MRQFAIIEICLGQIHSIFGPFNGKEKAELRAIELRDKSHDECTKCFYIVQELMQTEHE